jgi:teichuronic acid biosynthesis glycosyltransferase TuaG
LDNASQDTTLDVINTYKDSRIHLYPSKKNLGPYKGLNFLLDKVQGQYIAILDHDDLWHPAKLAKQIVFLEKNKKYV